MALAVGPTGYSPESIKQMREYAKALQEKKPWGNNPYFTWANGLDKASGSVIGALLENSADKRERETRGLQGEDTERYMAGTPLAPAPMNVPSPAPQPAAGGAAATGPFPSTPQPSSAQSLGPQGLPPGGLKVASLGSPPLPSPKGKPSIEDEIRAINSGTFKPADDYQSGIDTYRRQQEENPELRTPPQGGVTMGGSGSNIASVLAEIPQQPPAPIQTAQNGPPTSLQPGQLQSDTARYIGALMKRGVMSPEAASTQAQQMLGLRSATMPQYQTNEFGQVIKSEPGMPATPQPYAMPGSLGKVEALPGVPAGLKQTTIGPGGTLQQKIIPPTMQAPGPTAPTPQPQSQAAPPAATQAAPARATVQAPPAAPLPTSAPAATASAENAPPFKVASLANEATPVPPSADNPMGVQFSPRLEAQLRAIPSTSNLPEKEIDKYLNMAEDQGVKGGMLYKRPPMDTAEDILSYPGREKTELSAAENKNTNINANNAKFSEYYRNAGVTSDHLKADLKFAKEVLQNPQMENGPFAHLVTNVRSAKNELSSMMDRLGFKEQAEKLKSSGYNPDANQVYGKLLAGAVLQNIRNMLGPASGRFLASEVSLVQQALGNDNLSNEANRAVVEIVDKLNDRVGLISQMAHKYEKKHGLIDSDFLDAVEQMQKDHPIYTPDEIKPLMTKIDEKPKEEPKGGVLTTPPPTAPKSFTRPPP